MTETKAVYDATPWAGQLDATYTIEVNPGRPILCKKLSLVEELANGTIPNELETFILSGDFDHAGMEMDKNGQWVPKSDITLSNEQSDRWSNFLRICARSMVRPRLRLTGTPNYAIGEIAIKDLTYAEVYRVASVAIMEVVPALPATFPDHATDGNSRGTGEPVQPDDTLSGHDAEPLSRSERDRSGEPVLADVA